MFYIKLGISMVLFALTFFDSSISASNLQLMPYPKEVKMGTGKFRLDQEFTVTVDNLYWLEMSATWMEEYSYDDINDYYSYLP